MNNVIFEDNISIFPELPFKIHFEELVREGIYSHWHEPVEFLYCIEGTCSIQCDSKVLTMHQGETVAINPLSLHHINTDSSVKYLCLIVKSSFFAENGIKADKLLFDDIFSDETANALMKDIYEIYQKSPSVFSTAEKRLAVLSYVLYICKNYTSKNANSKINSKGYSAILNAVKYINDNFSKKLSLDELSEKANYSKYHFARMFKENTGVTVLEHINRIRCDNARTLLRDTEKSISEIGFECGFDSPSYFSKSFKEHYGVLPNTYRASCKKTEPI